MAQKVLGDGMQTEPVQVTRALDRHAQAGAEAAPGLAFPSFVEERSHVLWRMRRMAWLAALGLASWGLIIGTVLLLV